MTRKLRVNLKSDDGDTTYINYVLLDNEAVDIWAGLFNGPNTETNHALRFSDNVDPDIINGFIDKFNKESEIEESLHIPNFVMYGLSEDIELLNHIHSMFEEYDGQIEEKGWLFEHLDSIGIRRNIIIHCPNNHRLCVNARDAGSNMYCLKCDLEICPSGELGLFHITEALNAINVNVHTLESSVANFYRPSSTYTSAWISLPCNNQIRVRMPDSVKRLFQISFDFGDLCLGYATRGKNLEHIWKDNDVSLLRSGASATPQQYISRGIISMFSGDKKTKWSENQNESEENVRQRFNDWFDEENLSELGYVKDSIDNCLGYIKIGKFQSLDFQRDWTCEEITKHYAKYSTAVSMEII